MRRILPIVYTGFSDVHRVVRILKNAADQSTEPCLIIFDAFRIFNEDVEHLLIDYLKREGLEVAHGDAKLYPNNNIYAFDEVYLFLSNSSAYHPMKGMMDSRGIPCTTIEADAPEGNDEHTHLLKTNADL